MNQKNQPFTYSVRVSARARHVRIAVKPYCGLEVVIPKRFPQKQIPRILQQHEAWITRQLEKHETSLQAVALPHSIHITLTGTTYSIQYHLSATARLREKEGLLSIHYATEQQAVQLLRNWVRARARQELIPMLEQLACEFNFSFKRASIRSQKSRWGSCSSSGTISLNDQLLFMPAQTVRYLMIHELCHTRHMNHSSAFWQRVAGCCPDFKIHDKQLARGREKVPAWFSQSLFSG